MSKATGAGRFGRTAGLALILAAGMADPPALRGQAGQSDTGEVTAFGGTTFGIGAHPAVGGSAGLAFSRYSILLVETAFSPLGSNSVRKPPAGGPIDTSRLYDINLGLHIRIPVKDRWEPYAILGGGLLWNTFDQHVGPQGAASLQHYSNFDFGFQTGGGLRYYIREKWGIRPELKVVVSKQTYTRFSVGIFYVLPSNWP